MSYNDKEYNDLAQPLNAMSIHAITTHEDDSNATSSGTSSTHAVLEPDNTYSPRSRNTYMFDSSALLEPLPPWDGTDGFRRYSSAADSATSNHGGSPASASSATAQASSLERRYAQDIPLSLAERRQRNKAASAKYRAKKHAVTSQMSRKIEELTEHNSNLQRQLDNAHKENKELKQRCQALQRNQETTSSSSYHADASDEASNSPHESKKRKSFDSRTMLPVSPSRSKTIRGKSKK